PRSLQRHFHDRAHTGAGCARDRRTDPRETDAPNRAGQSRLRRPTPKKNFILTKIDNHYDNDSAKNLQRERNREAFSQLDEDQAEVIARKSRRGVERSDQYWLRRERLDVRRTSRAQGHVVGRRYRYEVH